MAEHEKKGSLFALSDLLRFNERKGALTRKI